MMAMIPMLNLNPNIAYPDLGRTRAADPASRELKAYLRWEFGGRAWPLPSVTPASRPRTVRSRFRAWAARALGRLLPSAPSAPPTDGDVRFHALGRAEGFPGDPVASGGCLPADVDLSARCEAAGEVR